MRKYFIALLLFLAVMTIASCGGDSLKSKIEGTWTNKAMTVTIDFDNKSYSGLMLGKEVDKKIKGVKKKDNYLVIEAGDIVVTARLLKNGELRLKKRGGIPITLQRKK